MMRFFYAFDSTHPNLPLFDNALLQMGIFPLMQWSDAATPTHMLREVSKPLPPIMLDLLAGQEEGSPLLVNRRLRIDRAEDQTILAGFGVE